MELSDIWGSQSDSAPVAFNPLGARWQFNAIEPEKIGTMLANLRIHNDVKDGKSQTIALLVASTAYRTDGEKLDTFKKAMPNEILKIISRTGDCSKLREHDFDALSVAISHLPPHEERVVLDAVSEAICNKPLSQLVQSHQFEEALELQG